MSTLIKITQLSRKQMVGPSGTFNRTTIINDKNERMSTLGEWADNWKVGDIVEGDIEQKPGTNKLGNPVVYLNIKNPNKKTYPANPVGNSSSQVISNPILECYKIAASLATLLYRDAKKAPKLSDIDDLVAELQKRIDPKKEQPVAEVKVPKISLDEDNEIVAVPVQQTLEEEDDEKPF
jgi:hypothetical protein